MPEVWLPPRMQAHCGGNQQVVVPGATVRQVINNLEREYPGSRDLLMDVEEDDLLPGLAVVVDGETSLLGLLERVQENSEVHFLPAIGGGSTLLISRIPKEIVDNRIYPLYGNSTQLGGPHSAVR